MPNEQNPAPAEPVAWEIKVVRPTDQEMLTEADAIIERIYPKQCNEVTEDWMYLQFIVHSLAKKPTQPAEPVELPPLSQEALELAFAGSWRSYKGLYEEREEQLRAALADAAALRRRIEVLETAAITVIAYNVQEAMDHYGNREEAENWACVRCLRAALTPTPEGEVKL